jgi:hypothetical protein
MLVAHLVLGFEGWPLPNAYAMLGLLVTDAPEELKTEIATLTANNERQAGSIHAFQHRFEHLTFDDLPPPEQRRTEARIRCHVEEEQRHLNRRLRRPR